jgi:hypothetical protein
VLTDAGVAGVGILRNAVMRSKVRLIVPYRAGIASDVAWAV